MCLDFAHFTQLKFVCVPLPCFQKVWLNWTSIPGFTCKNAREHLHIKSLPKTFFINYKTHTLVNECGGGPRTWKVPFCSLQITHNFLIRLTTFVTCAQHLTLVLETTSLHRVFIGEFPTEPTVNYLRQWRCKANNRHLTGNLIKSEDLTVA